MTSYIMCDVIMTIYVLENWAKGAPNFISGRGGEGGLDGLDPVLHLVLNRLSY